MKTKKSTLKFENGLKESLKRVVEFKELKFNHRLAEQLLRLQRDLAITLSSTSDLSEALELILNAICQIEGFDCGGVYIAEAKSGDFNLAYHVGLSSRFVELAAQYIADSPQARMVKRRKPIYGKYQEISSSKRDVHQIEGLRAIAVIPINHEDQIVAVLNVGSHSYDEIPAYARHVLESIAAQLGGVLSRLRAEAAMLDSKKDLTALFNSVNDFLFVLDYDGNILHVNPAVEERLGYSANEILSMNVINVHPPNRREEAMAIIAAMMVGELSECPIPLMTKSGELIPVETKVTNGRWSGQNVLFGLCRDITARKLAEDELQKAHDELELKVDIRAEELAKAVNDLQREAVVRKRTEESLRRSEERFLKIADNIREVFWLFDWKNQKVEYVSPAYKQIWGRSVEDLYANYEEWAASIYPDDLAYAEESFERIAQTGGGETRQYRIVRTDGKVRWVSDRGFAITDKNGDVVRIAGITEDITDQQQALDALRESEEKFRLLTDQSPNMIFINHQGRFVYVNRRCEEIMGYSKDEFYAPDFDFMTIVEPGSKDLIQSNFRSHMEGKEIPPHEYALTGKDGKKIDVIITAKLIIIDGKQSILGIITDITERKEKDKRLERQAKNLEEVITALKVLLEQREKEKTEIKETLLVNIKKLVYPYIEKLENIGLNQEAQTFVNIIKTNINDRVSPLANNLSSKYFSLTSSEIQIADLIKYGKASKEIASMLYISPKTVAFHRGNIRKKLGLLNKKINLRSYLQVFPH